MESVGNFIERRDPTLPRIIAKCKVKSVIKGKVLEGYTLNLGPKGMLLFLPNSEGLLDIKDRFISKIKLEEGYKPVIKGCEVVWRDRDKYGIKFIEIKEVKKENLEERKREKREVRIKGIESLIPAEVLFERGDSLTLKCKLDIVDKGGLIKVSDDYLTKEGYIEEFEWQIEKGIPFLIVDIKYKEDEITSTVKRLGCITKRYNILKRLRYSSMIITPTTHSYHILKRVVSIIKSIFNKILLTFRFINS